MVIPDLPYDFYGARVLNADIGPRRESTLTLGITNLGKQAEEPYSITMRFGGIVNFEEASRFFAVTRWETLHFLRYSASQRSKPGSLWIEMEFDNSEDYLLIHCSHVSIAVMNQ